MNDEIFSVKKLNELGIVANSPIEKRALEAARKIMIHVHEKTLVGVNAGKGPFYAEMNALKNAHKKFRAYNLAPENLTIYINAEPCIMCAGAIMWSGVKTIFFSVPSKDVEAITGFDEGYKPNWIKEFKKRGIAVYGNIEAEHGKKVLQKYVSLGKEIYKPTR